MKYEIIIHYFVILSVYIILHIEAKKGCPIMPDILNASASQIIGDAEEILNFTKYDTNEMKFYVITPNSYPNFVNPKGEDVDWSNIDCNGKPMLVNCHGFLETGLQIWVVDLVRTYVTQYGGCAVSSDYGGSTQNLNYFTVVRSTNSIAKVIADYVADNICPVTDCSEQLQMHGHSWGAHTCGIAGYLLGKRDPGFKPARMITSDAAGPYFNIFNVSDYSSHLSKESANIVINIKTSTFFGTTILEWADQSQYIGACGSHQQQCKFSLNPLDNEMCDHHTSVFITKSTMVKKFPKVNVTKCASCKTLLPMFQGCTDERDYLGWQSEGKPGLFIRKDLPVCLITTLNDKLHD